MNALGTIRHEADRHAQSVGIPLKFVKGVLNDIDGPTQAYTRRPLEVRLSQCRSVEPDIVQKRMSVCCEPLNEAKRGIHFLLRRFRKP